MFYLETKDGDKFFTDTNSDDKAEFEKIIEQKLGSQAAELFKQLIEDAEQKNRDVLIGDLEYVIRELRDIQNQLQKI